MVEVEVVVVVEVVVEVEPMQDWQLVLLPPMLPGHQYLLKMVTKKVTEGFPAALQ